MFPKLLTKRKKEVKVDSLTAQVSTFLHRVHINVSDYTRENMLITDIVILRAACLMAQGLPKKIILKDILKNYALIT